MNKTDKLRDNWLKKILNNENLEISDLFPFSKINLKKARSKKKFLKYYHRYVLEDVYKTYWGCLIATPLIRVYKSQAEFDIEPITPIESMPKAKIVYLDYQYSSKENE